jgi:hypothetical protein
MSAGAVRKDLQQFEVSIKKLSSSISQSSALWKDDKFSELFASVSSLASDSKDFMVSGERFCTAIEQFERISSENV